MDGTANRHYDLANPHDLKDALLHTAGAYMDYRQCEIAQDAVLEDFDEALENSDFTAWFWLAGDAAKVDELTQNAYEAIKTSAGLLDDVTDRAWKNLAMLLKTALGAAPDVQAMVWGAAYDVPESDRDELLEELLDAVSEAGPRIRREDDPGAVFFEFFHEHMKERR